MYLLKRVSSAFPVSICISFTFHNVPIKTGKHGDTDHRAYQFTFHNVPIKTGKTTVDQLAASNLHSTMYLLKLPFLFIIDDVEKIYIPQCTY